MLVRGLYYEGWDPTGKPIRLRHKDEFLAPIADALANDGVDAEDIKHILPASLRTLWP